MKQSIFGLTFLFTGCNQKVKNTDSCFQKCGKALYTDIFKNTHFPDAYFDYEQSICCSKQLNKPLMVFFNSLACVNCRRVEETIFSNDSIAEYLREHYLVANLYVDEQAVAVDTKRVVSFYRGEKLTRIGELNNALQMAKCQTGSQPCLVVLDENGNSLMNHLSYTIDVEEVYNWLKIAMQKFLET